MKILMICLGNICRSPLAEGILRHKIKQAGLDWMVDSAGTGGYHIGEAPHILSQKAARENGINISNLKARLFVKEDMILFDKIYVMDAENYNDVRRMSKELWNKKKVDLVLNELYPNENRGVPDPWFGTEKDFHIVFEMLDKACGKIISKLADVQISK
jgi:protein-tyrosine phosphatase